MTSAGFNCPTVFELFISESFSLKKVIVRNRNASQDVSITRT